MIKLQKDFNFLAEDFLDEYRVKPVNWGFASGPNSLGEITYRRTYSRDGEEWWQTVRRVVEGTYEVLYSHCQYYNIPFDIVVAKHDAQKMYDLIFNFKFLPPGRGLWVHGTDHVRQNGGMSLNNPLHEDTKILTKEYGWITLKEIESEEVEVLTSVHDYGTHAELVKKEANAATWAQATISEAEIHPTRKITFEDKDGLIKEVVASNNHRWLTRRNTKGEWKRVDGDQLNIGDWVPVVKPQNYFALSRIGQQHGFFFGDGTRSNGELHQFADSCEILSDLFGATQWIDEDHNVVRHLPLAWSSLPSGEYLRDKKYIYGFLSGYFAADGYVDIKGTPTLSSARLEELEKAAELFKLIGVRSTEPYISIKEGSSNNLVESRNALYEIRLTPIDLREDFFLKTKHRERWLVNVGQRKRDWMKVMKIEEDYGEHRVLCAEVPGYEQFVIDGFILTSNCAFVSTEEIADEFDKPFAFLMDVSMLGVGCGFDTKGANKIVWDPSHQNAVQHMVADSREGWVESLSAVLKWGFGIGPKPEFDYSLVRPKGSPIRGFGGVSEGPQPLIELHNRMEKMALSNAGNSVTSRDITDIMNMIGVCVVAGNVRRCMPEGTWVHTVDGPKAIESITTKDKIVTHNGIYPVQNVFNQGIQNTIKIQHQFGDLECTPNHRVAVFDSINSYRYEYAGNLQPGDRLVWDNTGTDGQKTQLPEFNWKRKARDTRSIDISIPELSSEIAWMLGYLAGDGYVFLPGGKTPNGYVSFAVSNLHGEIRDRLVAVLESFGLKAKVVDGEGEYWKVNVYSTQLAYYLSQFKLSHGRFDIPECIKLGTRTVRGAYLMGLFDSDGSSRTRPLNGITMVTHDFLKEAQKLYATLGIATKLQLCRSVYSGEMAKSDWQPLWKLNIVGTENVEQFVDISEFSSKYENVSKSNRSANGFAYSTVMVKESGIKGSWITNNKNTTSDRLKRKIDLDLQIKPVEVLAILPGREVQTYDIEVKEINQFVAEGFIVHNSAEIALGDKDDEVFLNLKNYEKYPEREEFGWTSNNSLIVNVGDKYDDFAERIAANGEPGLVWLDNIRNYSRMTDKPDGKDWRVKGTNPCSEQSLESYEVCNLVETFPYHHKNLNEYKETLKYAFIYAKAVSLLPTHVKETNAVMLRNRRIGTSMSGVAQFIAHKDVQNLIRWCKGGYKTVLHYDKVYSEWLCVRESIKRTSVKPSGTVSLLAGATPGCHYPTFRYYIRRMRFAEGHPDLEAFERAGYFIEKAKFEPNTVVVEFPICGDDKVPTEQEVKLEDKVDVAVLLQEYWADNQVSCTATFNPKKESKKILRVIKDNEEMLKSISFLPMLEQGAFAQMPYEAITKEKYEETIGRLSVIEWDSRTTHDQQDAFCDGMACIMPTVKQFQAEEIMEKEVVNTGLVQ